VFKSDANVLSNPAYADIRDLFRQTPEGVETLMQDMVARSPLRRWSAPVKAAPDRREQR
jgi:hypothetical protein